MRGDIKAIEGDMKDFKENQMYTNDGIFALCSVVKELVGPSQKTNSQKPNAAVKLLDKFLFRTPQLFMHRPAVSTSTAGCCCVHWLWPYILLGVADVSRVSPVQTPALPHQQKFES